MGSACILKREKEIIDIKHRKDHTRTTLNLNEETISCLEFLSRLHGGIVWALNTALQPIRTYYEEKEAFNSPTWGKYHKERLGLILDLAEKLECDQKTLRNKNKRKSIVISKRYLKYVNDISKKESIKRDFIIMAALSIEKKECYGSVKFELKLKKELLEGLWFNEGKRENVP